MVRWLRWHCPPDTGFEIRALSVWGRARYLSVTEAPHNTNFHTWMGKKHFLFFLKPPRPGTEPRTLAWKAAVLTTTLGPPPRQKAGDTQQHYTSARLTSQTRPEHWEQSFPACRAGIRRRKGVYPDYQETRWWWIIFHTLLTGCLDDTFGWNGIHHRII